MDYNYGFNEGLVCWHQQTHSADETVKHIFGVLFTYIGPIIQFFLDLKELYDSMELIHFLCVGFCVLQLVWLVWRFVYLSTWVRAKNFTHKMVSNADITERFIGEFSPETFWSEGISTQSPAEVWRSYATRFWVTMWLGRRAVEGLVSHCSAREKFTIKGDGDMRLASHRNTRMTVVIPRFHRAVFTPVYTMRAVTVIYCDELLEELLDRHRRGVHTMRDVQDLEQTLASVRNINIPSSLLDRVRTGTIHAYIHKRGQEQNSAGFWHKLT